MQILTWKVCAWVALVHTLCSKDAADLPNCDPAISLLENSGPSKPQLSLKAMFKGQFLPGSQLSYSPPYWSSPLPVPLSSGLCQKLLENTNYNLSLFRITSVLPALSAVRLEALGWWGAGHILVTSEFPTTPNTILSKECRGSGSIYWNTFAEVHYQPYLLLESGLFWRGVCMCRGRLSQPSVAIIYTTRGLVLKVGCVTSDSDGQRAWSMPWVTRNYAHFPVFPTPENGSCSDRHAISLMQKHRCSAANTDKTNPLPVSGGLQVLDTTQQLLRHQQRGHLLGP